MKLLLRENTRSETDKKMEMKKIIVLLIAGLGLSFAASAQLPQMELKDIDGKTVQVNELSDGQHPLIISFFATWCHPCMRELSAIHEVYEDWQEETGVRLVAVSIDKSSNVMKVKPLVRSKGWNYEVLLDTNQSFSRALNVTLIPSVFLLDKTGKIVYRHQGYVEGNEDELYEEVLKLVECQ